MTDHAISLNNDGVPVIPASGEISGGARPRCSSDPLRRIVVLDQTGTAACAGPGADRHTTPGATTAERRMMRFSLVSW